MQPAYNLSCTALNTQLTYVVVSDLCAWFTQYNSSCKQVACDRFRQKWCNDIGLLFSQGLQRYSEINATSAGHICFIAVFHGRFCYTRYDFYMLNNNMISNIYLPLSNIAVIYFLRIVCCGYPSRRQRLLALNGLALFLIYAPYFVLRFLLLFNQWKRQSKQLSCKLVCIAFAK